MKAIGYLDPIFASFFIPNTARSISPGGKAITISSSAACPFLSHVTRNCKRRLATSIALGQGVGASTLPDKKELEALISYSPQSFFPLHRSRLGSIRGNTFSAGIVNVGPVLEHPLYQQKIGMLKDTFCCSGGTNSNMERSWITLWSHALIFTTFPFTN